MNSNFDLKLKFVLHGWAANTSRRAEGVAFIAHDPMTARDRLGSFQEDSPRILVCPSLDWSWSDVANSVAGVVTNHGTRVSRGSEVSGIVQVAAVLGTRDATERISEGDFIQIICEGNEALARVYRKS
jgi:pyruvate,water dikinase